MPKIDSEIINKYAEMLDDAGFFKEAYPSLEAYKDDPQARAGSDSIETIEALYGVKPETIDATEYSENIMEAAHPNSVIIAPSYDKINALVENNIERHNIMCNIALKPPTATHTNPKYARKELVFELVKIANEMDSKNQEELFKLADDCLLALNKEAFDFDDMERKFKGMLDDAGSVGEGAAAGAAIGAVAGGLVTVWTGPGVLAGIPVGAATGAVAGGIIAAFAKTSPQVKSVEANAQELLEQMEDVRSKVPEQEEFFTQADAIIRKLVATANKYNSILNKLHEHAFVPESQFKSDQVESGGPSEADASMATEASKDFVKASSQTKKLHDEFNRRNATGQFVNAKPGKILSPIYWFVKDDIEDVDSAFKSLEAAIESLEHATKQNVDKAISTAVSKSEEKKETAPAASPSTDDKGKGFMDFIRNLNPGT